MTSPDNHEQRLVKRLQDGNRAAAREFYALYADFLSGICARYIVNEEDQKDVFQESFINIFSNIRQYTYRGEGSLKAWAARIVVNESLKYIRSGHQHELIPIDMDIADKEEDNPLINAIPPDAIMEMLSRLPIGYRTVFNLYFEPGVGYYFNDGSSISTLYKDHPLNYNLSIGLRISL